MAYSIVKSDCLEFLRAQPADSVDLVFGSPPYTEARLYLEDGENLGIALKAEEWSAWMVQVFTECRRVCKGLVAFVVDGQTSNYRWNASPAMLMADLHRAGFNLRKPPIFHRIGIPGSGGPDWFRGDTEFIICTTRPGKLPWSDNTADGHPPKWAPGGDMSYRLSDGTRRNQWGGHPAAGGNRKQNGDREPTGQPSHKLRTKGGSPKDGIRTAARAPRGMKDGDVTYGEDYDQPSIANPGNVTEQIYTANQVAELLRGPGDYQHHNVGGGLMGEQSAIASQNEAPFPERLAERYVLSFCPPGGKVLDCFSGSGTVAAVSHRHGRNFIGCDLRQSQVDLALKRLANETPMLFT